MMVIKIKFQQFINIYFVFLDDNLTGLADFRELCKNNLQNIDVNLRPRLSTLLQHEFFNHDFIKIHSFLIELPLKSDDEKNEFFHNLAEKLQQFPQVTVATLLGNLLLSRMVLLNKTAQEEFLPYVFCLKEGIVNIFSYNYRVFLIFKHAQLKFKMAVVTSY